MSFSVWLSLGVRTEGCNVQIVALHNHQHHQNTTAGTKSISVFKLKYHTIKKKKICSLTQCCDAGWKPSLLNPHLLPDIYFKSRFTSCLSSNTYTPVRHLMRLLILHCWLGGILLIYFSALQYFLFWMGWYVPGLSVCPSRWGSWWWTVP